MKWIYNRKVSFKLILGFVLIAAITGVVGGIAIRDMHQIDESYSKLYVNYGASLGDLGEAAKAFQRIRVNLRELILFRDFTEKTKIADRIKELDKQLVENIAQYEKTVITEYDRKLFAKLKHDLDQYTPIREKIILLALNGQEEQALQLLRGDGLRLTGDIDKTIDEMTAYKVSEGSKSSKINTALVQNSMMLMVGVIVFAMVVAIAGGMFLSRMISSPINQLVNAAQNIANGNLNIEINVPNKDELGLLAEAFLAMAKNINDVMANINASSEQVATGAKQLSDSSMELSQGATEQASSIEQLTASIEEIASQTRKNAQYANHANELATEAKNNAVAGNGRMNDMLKAMEDINHSSASISKIIKVIDEIAFQTNILALNAAVEAARAGQHGKGFAVVAEEVRNLAARSANAAKETTAMIEGSMRKVQDGTQIAHVTAEALNEIVDGVTKVAELINRIAAASDEQASGIGQVNQGIAQVSQVVQTNSATAEESAAASEELAGQADMMREMVSRFQLQEATDYKSSPAINSKPARGTTNYPEYRRNLPSRTKIALSDAEFGKY